MVAALITEKTPNLVPVPPDWLSRQGQRGPSTNININDIFWKRAPHESSPGYIIVGPSALIGVDGRELTAQAARWKRKGRIPLIEYSYTNRISQRTGQRETIETNQDRLTTPDRYYWMFANGGAHLFPIEQIVEHHWHVNPPFGLSKDVFPQLAEWDVPEPFYCGACAGGPPPRNSEEELVSHLLISHRMTLPQARDLIASYDVHVPPRGQRGLVLRRKAQVIEKQAPEVSQLASPSPDQPQGSHYICDQCGEGFATPLGKVNHVRKEHKAAASQPPDAMNGAAEGREDA